MNPRLDRFLINLGLRKDYPRRQRPLPPAPDPSTMLPSPIVSPKDSLPWWLWLLFITIDVALLAYVYFST